VRGGYSSGSLYEGGDGKTLCAGVGVRAGGKGVGELMAEGGEKLGGAYGGRRLCGDMRWGICRDRGRFCGGG